uniref:Uncharacterized protein n=1 Tax=Oryza nivara TaxID=4536 RepID=A0A0E0IGB0_ORYNI
MEARGKKRKGEVELSHPALEREIVPTTSPLPIAIRRSTLESGEGSSESVASDTGTAKALADDVVHIANALCMEMAAYNNTSNSPKPKAWENLAKKMFTKCRKKG